MANIFLEERDLLASDRCGRCFLTRYL